MSYVRSHRYLIALLVIVSSLFILVLGLIGRDFLILPKVIAVSPGNNQQHVEWGSEVKVSFNYPILRKDLNATIEPTVEGEWSYSDQVYSESLIKTVVFKPTQYFDADKEYTLRLADIRTVTGKESQDFQYSFKTQPVPSVASIIPEEGQKEVSICDPISVELTGSNPDLAQFSFSLEPALELEATFSEDQKSYSLRPTVCFQQGVTYKLAIKRRAVNEVESVVVAERSFTTKPGIKVIDINPSGGNILANSKNISISFDQDIVDQDFSSLISITPALEGSWRMETARKITFSFSQKLDFSTKYQVKIIKGLKNQQNGYLEADVNHTFTTIGAVEVSSFLPRNGVGGVGITSPVKVTFNQAVDHASVEQLFSITPNAKGSYSWSGLTMSFIPTSLQKDESYTVKIGPGVKSTNGLDSKRAYSTSFSTEQSITLLNVPLYLQQRKLSCEVASLRMALAYKGVNVSENELMSHVGFDPATRDNGIWGDPDQAFVGSIDGRQNTTGYGVHWGPISHAANQYRSAQSFSGWSVSQLAESIAAGNPVVIWGVYPGFSRDSWVTSAGKTISTWKGEHVRTVVGFKGKASNPTQFIINDPVLGRLTWNISTLRNNWATLGNSGVVVY